MKKLLTRIVLVAFYAACFYVGWAARDHYDLRVTNNFHSFNRATGLNLTFDEYRSLHPDERAALILRTKEQVQ